MHCPTCQRENPKEARFCNGCGRPLDRACAACGHTNPSDASFCSACGAGLEPADALEPTPDPAASERDPRAYTPKHLAERILQTRAALEGERKHVTVLFCDLVDSTPLAERVGAEAMHEIMDRCFALILDQVHRYEGTVNQFLGDGVMALYGAPLALEDAPHRAVTTALAIQRELEPFAAEVKRAHDVDFRMRIGIHSGPVVVGRIGDDLRMDYTAIGDTTNLAARLQGLAPPGGAIISEATEGLVEGYFELEELGAVSVKGKSEPVTAFRVLEAREGLGRVEARARTGLTPLVGREHEFAALQRAFASAAEGKGQVVFLVGEAGIGKSRLRYEFQRSLEGQPHEWVEGRCMTYARDFPFHPIVDGLRRRFGVEEGDDAATLQAKLEADEARSGGGLEWTLPYMRLLLSLPSGDEKVDAQDAATRRSETFRAVCARFQRLCEKAPFVLVVEDIHWIDRASEEFLRYMIESIPTSRVLLLLTHRPGYSHPFGDRSYHTRLALQPLSEPEMGRMAEAMLASSEVPDVLRRLITSRAEGNPFFIEEVVQSLVEDGSVRKGEGTVELARDIDRISVPGSIQEVLMARLDRLDEEPKRALQIGAVIGREFALRLLERIVEAGDRLGPMIQELRALELIYEKAAHPELAFMFKHALTRDVAYDSVLEGRRRTLHRIVGLAIEELYRERLAEHVEQLAHHFTAAREWEKAFVYTVRAARKAAVAFANESAVEHARRALEIAGHLGDAVDRDARRRLEELQGMCNMALSRFHESGDALRRAAELCDEPADRAINLGRAGHSYFWGHHYPELREAVREGEQVSLAHGLDDGLAFAKAMRAFDSATSGDWPGYRGGMRDVEALAPQHPEVLIILSYLQGQAAEWTGDYRQATATQQKGIDLARQHRLPGLLVPGLWFRGKALCCLGRYGESLSQLEEAYGIAERIGDHAHRARLLNTLGWLHGELAAYERAAEYNRRSLETAEEMLKLDLVAGIAEIHCNASVNLAGNRIVLGELDAADALLEPVRRELAEGDDPWMLWRWSIHLEDAEARLALARGDPETAVRRLDAEIASAHRNGAPKLVARGLELRGRACLMMDDRDGAEECLRGALQEADAIVYAPAAWRATALLGELARRAGDRPAAERASADVSRRVEAAAGALGDEELRRKLLSLAPTLVDDLLAVRG